MLENIGQKTKVQLQKTYKLNTGTTQKEQTTQNTAKQNYPSLVAF